ncbi:MAG: hypothetical protein ABIG95_04805 [Candidatus Woesearchaeota archaeon]
MTRKTEKTEISKEEFEKLKRISTKAIIRDSYLFSDNPNISIKIYHGNYEGLVRAEVEFLSEKEARAFEPLEWMGEEITESDLGKDARLVKLGKHEFRELLGWKT